MPFAYGLLVLVLTGLISGRAFAENIVAIEVKGPRAVQPDAITELMDLKVGSEYQPGLVREDIKRVFESGFFDDVQIRAVPESDGLRLVVLVTEKPSVREIRFVGFNEVDEDSAQEKFQTKKYTIINDSKLNGDLRTIEQLYVEKGYYLARASYTLDKQQSSEVDVIFSVVENEKVTVGRVNLLGNMFFSDNELSSGMFTRRQNWASGLFSAGTFKDEFVNRDKEYLAYYYKDNGFAEAAVSAPASRLDAGRQNVEVSYYIEEGERFDIGKITFRGDLILSDAELREQLSLQPGQLFRISKFQRDLQTLQDVYGNQGYAFADVVPRTTADREAGLIDIDYEVTKGKKVYFRKFDIVGNSKTRDNVIRRNMRVSEGELFHSARLRDSKARIERLGFFEEVQIQRFPDASNQAMDLQIKVKEKSTGSLSASIGATPDRDGRDFSFFAQGKYSDANLLGKGWATSFSFDIIPPAEAAADVGLGLNTSFREPSINDGPWSLSLSGSFKRSESRPFDGEPLAVEEEYRGGLYLGRSILGLLLGRELLDDDLRATIGYSFKLLERPELSPVFERTQEKGITHAIITGLTYDKTNNYLFPTDGYYLALENTYAAQLVEGDHEFGRVEFTAEYYIPLVFGDDYVTNFRFMFSPGVVYPVGPQSVPIWERYRLGSQLTMKAYKDRDKVISPRETVVDSPYSSNVRERPVGGNRRLYGSAEYFVPLIPEANLRFVTFAEAGSVLGEDDDFRFNGLKYDVGFGFRWMTPIAPFRFEFAFPVEERRLGQSEFVIFIGGDTASRF